MVKMSTAAHPKHPARIRLIGLVWLAILTLAVPVWAATRQPQVAGQFYPADPVELSQTVHNLLDRAAGPFGTEKPRILIVPHAGYVYSGPVAAQAFHQIQAQTYEGVVVVGFTHRMQFPGASVDTVDTYTTPLGELPIDTTLVAQLQASGAVSHMEAAHASGEHSLEVELPFLQATLGRPKIVPIIMGSARLDDAEQLANALAALASQQDELFIFSTDLSHYHQVDEARRIDQGTVSALLFETAQATQRLFQAGQIEACGQGPILAALLLARKLGSLERRLIRYGNSADTAGHPERVVGYAAIAMYDRPSSVAGRLSEPAGQALVKAARSTLERHLNGRPSDSGDVATLPELSRSAGLFVTLRQQGKLRGCMGRIESDQPLQTMLPIVALEAAQNDPRFHPVTPVELGELDIEVSVLTLPTKLEDVQQLVPGRDGVVLEYQGHRGVFLPQVWDETGWTRVEFLRELASQKAGLPPDTWQQATLYTFQDQAFEEER